MIKINSNHKPGHKRSSHIPDHWKRPGREQHRSCGHRHTMPDICQGHCVEASHQQRLPAKDIKDRFGYNFNWHWGSEAKQSGRKWTRRKRKKRMHVKSSCFFCTCVCVCVCMRVRVCVHVCVCVHAYILCEYSCLCLCASLWVTVNAASIPPKLSGRKAWQLLCHLYIKLGESNN